MKNIVLFSLIVLVFFSCKNGHKASGDEFILEGKFIHSRADQIKIELLHPDKIEPFDSVRLDENGQFKINKEISEPVFLKLSVAKDNFITLLMAPGESAILSGDVKQLDKTYEISGSAGSELIQKFRKVTRMNYAKLDSLSKIWENSKYAENKLRIRDSLDSLGQIIYNAQRKSVIDFVEKNPTNMASIFIIYQFFGQAPMLDEMTDMAYYQKLSDELGKIYPSNEHVVKLKMRINEVKTVKIELDSIKARLDTGRVAPDFSNSDLQGKEYKVSSFRGQPVLLHFFAAWSKPAMNEISTIKMLWKTFGSKGLIILSISLDDNKDLLTKAIETEKINWPVLYDQLGIMSPIAKLYNVETLPYYFLLDKNGRIKAKSNSINNISNDIPKVVR